MKKQKIKNECIIRSSNINGITLVALVVTIIVLIILAGISINLVLGDKGIVTIGKRAKENIELAQIEEEKELNELYTQLESKNTEIKTNNANAPKLLTGMTPIKFEMPTEEKMGEVVETTKRDSDWYNYGITYNTKRWANAKTEDGSMWVWIPRFAYKITYIDNTDKSKGGIVEVVFLKGTSDNYYDENGNIQTAQRQTSENQTIDTTADFTVHPAFTNESSINYANGGWDKELEGIWVAKFAAGYASGNNNTEVKDSSVSYSQKEAVVDATERGTTSYGSENARNWLDGEYGSTTTAIKYPVFQGTTYTMNYINVNDCYNIAKVLNENGNIYGLSTSDSNSHLMKNSEWGAVAYLSKSIYGQNEKEITINNVNLNSGNRKRTTTIGKSGVDSVYGVTGCTNNTTDTTDILTTIDEINNISKNIANENGIYVWNQKNGQNSSTTGTIYGIYDISGCVWERTSSYIANNNESLKLYGESIAYDKNTLKIISTKYTTVYPNNESGENNIDIAGQKNFINNTKIYGDAVRESTGKKTEVSNSGNSGWNTDNSYFSAIYGPFLARGGHFKLGSGAGAFAFGRDAGDSAYYIGFRVVLSGK